MDAEKSNSVSLRELRAAIGRRHRCCFWLPEAALHGGRTQCPDRHAGLCLCPASSFFGFGPLPDKTGRYAVFGAVPPVVVILHRWCLLRLWPLWTPVSSCWYSIHSCNLTPSLKTSKEWCSMNDIPSIWMLLTLAPNSTRLFSLPLTMGRM